MMEMRRISKSLHEAVEMYAVSEEVCSFQIIQLLQEELQKVNEETCVEEPKSLWEEMQLRQKDASSMGRSEGLSFRFSGGELFDESPDVVVEGHGRTPKAAPAQHRKQESKEQGASVEESDMDLNSDEYSDRIVVHENAVVAIDSSEEEGCTTTTLATTTTEGRSFSSLVNSFRQIKNIPDIVRHLLDLTKSSHSKDSNSIRSEVFGGEVSYTDLQRDMLIGRLLFEMRSEMWYSDVIREYVLLDLIPAWLGSMLMKNHSMFKVAFKRSFSRTKQRNTSLDSFWGWLNSFDSRILQQRQSSGDTNGQQCQEQGEVGTTASLGRYATDFNEVRVLGRGGYGKVYLAVHKFDGRYYAVKRVTLNTPGEEFEKIMREVQTLSRMQHQHVVRYYAAWLETSVGIVHDTSSEDELFTEDESSSEVYSENIESGDDEDASSANEPKEVQCLYIQMEYCRTTLRKLMDEHLNDDKEKWKIVRQLLSGLIYMHKKGVIHRDLKPANIFIDSLGDCKLGDFGLAKDLKGQEKEVFETDTAEKYNEFDDTQGTTGVCGTGFYIAPEISETGSHRQYDEKVDIFSLGIIVFELWNTFETEMERFITLRDLRERGKLPKSFQENHPDVAKLVSWLLSNDPQQRPTAYEALKSSYIPATIANDDLTDLIRSLPDNPSARDKIVLELFKLRNQDQTKEKTSFDLVEYPGAPDGDLNLRLGRRTELMKIFSREFRKAGAIEMGSRGVGVSVDASASSVIAMTSHGDFIALRQELRSKFVEWALSRVIDGERSPSIQDGFKRYEISTIYRDSSHGFMPKSFMFADLDALIPLASTTGVNIPLGEAELISVVCNALNRIDSLDRWELRISHSQLLHAVMIRLNLPKDIQEIVYRHLRVVAMSVSPSNTQARSTKWNTVGQELTALGLARDIVLKIKEIFVQCSGDFQSILHKLNVFIPQKKSKGTGQTVHQSHAWFDELKSLYSFLDSFGVPNTHIVLDPLLSPQEDYFSGILFELHLVDDMDGSSTLVAAGGRFDSLIRASWASQKVAFGNQHVGEPPCGGVGITINIDRLAVSGPANPSPSVSSADVLVCSKGSGATNNVATKITERALSRIHERVKILKMLRESGIRADMMSAIAPSMTEQFAYASERHIPYLVIIDVDDLQMSSTVKIKQIHGKFEEDVALDDASQMLIRLLKNTNAKSA